MARQKKVVPSIEFLFKQWFEVIVTMNVSMNNYERLNGVPKSKYDRFLHSKGFFRHYSELATNKILIDLSILFSPAIDTQRISFKAALKYLERGEFDIYLKNKNPDFQNDEVLKTAKQEFNIEIKKMISSHREFIQEVEMLRNTIAAHRDPGYTDTSILRAKLKNLVEIASEIYNAMAGFFYQTYALMHLTHHWDVDEILKFCCTHFDYYAELEKNLG